MEDTLRTSGIGFVVTLSIASVALAQSTLPSRTLPTSRFDLTLDGTTSLVMAVEGGEPRIEVVQGVVSPTGITEKHLGEARQEPLSFDAPLSALGVIDWIASTWKAPIQPVIKSGVLERSDLKGIVVSRLDFSGALLTETTFPALDRRVSESGRISVKLVPGATVRSFPRTPLTASPRAAQKAQPWMTSDFNLEIAGFDTKRVTRIESFTVKQPAIVASDATFRSPRGGSLQPGAIEFPHLKIVVSGSAEDLRKWYERSLLAAGKPQDKPSPLALDEPEGRLQLLAPNLGDVLLTVELENLGIFSFRELPADASSSIEGVEVELYCERMTLVR